MKMIWTVDHVKEELPYVRVRLGATIVQGKVSGRRNPFATVSIRNTGTLHSESQLWVNIEYSWETIAHSLNTDKPLIAE